MSISFGVNSNLSFEPGCVFTKKVDILMHIFKIFRKFAENVAISGILDLHSVPRRNNVNRLLEKLSVLRVPGGNQVDGLPPARHTDSLVK